MYKEVIPQNEPTENSGVNLVLLLDTLDATESQWEVLPDPYPLLLQEGRRAIAEAVGVSGG